MFREKGKRTDKNEKGKESREVLETKYSETNNKIRI
jgi:hypothetical protein